MENILDVKLYLFLFSLVGGVGGRKEGRERETRGRKETKSHERFFFRDLSSASPASASSSCPPSPDSVSFRFVHQLVTLPMDDVIPTTLRSTLERVCRKFFNKDAAHKSPKHQRFVELYQTTFEKDFQARGFLASSPF